MAATTSYLDLPEFRQLYCRVSSSPSMKLYIEGIKCAKCVQKIESLRNTMPFVARLDVDIANQTALVE
ncbi:MAG: hypothetical protein COT73_09880, partial [Bdellovibrio sp. CG10_big_fil_rev_8_21_14_0_10_47_8]